MDRLTGIEVFLQVAGAGSFSAAARQLGLSRSAVSKHVQALEQHLGARLLNRTTRRLSLTDVGASFYERAREILAELEEAEQAVTSLQAQPRGLLKVNAPLSFGILHLAPLVPEFLARYPDIEIDLSYNDRFVDLVNEGFDVAVRIGQLRDSSLLARRIAPVRILPCASPTYLAAHGTPRTPAELAGHNCLVYSYQPYAHEWRFTDAAGALHKVHVGGNLRANNGETLLSAAVQGLGIVLSPDFIAARALRAGEVVALLPEYTAPAVAVHAVYPYTRTPPAKLRAFVDFLVERLSEPEWTGIGAGAD